MNSIKRLWYKYRTISKDFILNIMASIVATGILQIIIYPLLAIKFGSEEYGALLTIMGVANTLCGATGNTLNNTRLIMQGEYGDDGLMGDYKIILLGLNVLSVIVFVPYYLYTSNANVIEITFLILYIIASSVKAYVVVDYRLIINFQKIVICSIITAIGNLFGVGIIWFTKCEGFWPLIFAMGEMFGLIYVLLNSRFLKEKFCITKKFKIVLKKETILLISSVVANILIYLDRLMLLPMLGGTMVTTYTVASVFGKSLGIIMTPIAGVLLGYFAQKSFRMTRKDFWRLNFSILIVGLFFEGISVVFGEWFTGLLYPSTIDIASPYLQMANMVAILGIVTSMTQPAILRFAPTFWQLVLQIFYGVSYMILGYIGTRINGLNGFVKALLVVNIIKLFSLYVLGNIYIERNTPEKKVVDEKW